MSKTKIITKMHEQRMTSRLLAKNEYKRQINAGMKVNWSKIG